MAALNAGIEEQVQLHEKDISEEASALQVDLPELPEPAGMQPEADSWQEETQMEMAEAQE